MSDLSANKDAAEAGSAAAASTSPWLAIKKLAARVQDWFGIQSTAVKMMVVAVAILIPLTASYSFVLWQRQAAVAEQVKARRDKLAALQGKTKKKGQEKAEQKPEEKSEENDEGESDE